MNGMSAGDDGIGVQVHELIKKLHVMSGSEWKKALHTFRSRFFGSNHKELPFLVKLHMITSCASLDNDIFWLEDGASFAINRDGYEKRIMFVFFDQQRLKSFQNRMSDYKFVSEPSVGRFPVEDALKFSVYRHPWFVRGRQDLSFTIRTHPSRSKAIVLQTNAPNKSARNSSEIDEPAQEHQEQEEGEEKEIFIDMSLIFDENERSRSDDSEMASSSASGTASVTQAQKDQFLRDLDIDMSPSYQETPDDGRSMATFSINTDPDCTI